MDQYRDRAPGRQTFSTLLEIGHAFHSQAVNLGDHIPLLYPRSAARSLAHFGNDYSPFHAK